LLKALRSVQFTQFSNSSNLYFFLIIKFHPQKMDGIVRTESMGYPVEYFIPVAVCGLSVALTRVKAGSGCTCLMHGCMGGPEGVVRKVGKALREVKKKRKRFACPDTSPVQCSCAADAPAPAMPPSSSWSPPPSLFFSFLPAMHCTCLIPSRRDAVRCDHVIPMDRQDNTRLLEQEPACSSALHTEV
jgi:hypothetical protein